MRHLNVVFMYLPFSRYRHCFVKLSLPLPAGALRELRSLSVCALGRSAMHAPVLIFLHPYDIAPASAMLAPGNCTCPFCRGLRPLPILPRHSPEAGFRERHEQSRRLQRQNGHPYIYTIAAKGIWWDTPCSRMAPQAAVRPHFRTRKQPLHFYRGCFRRRYFCYLGCSKNYNVLGFTSIIISLMCSAVCTNITKVQISFCAVCRRPFVIVSISHQLSL